VIAQGIQDHTHYIAISQLSPSKLFTAAAMLKTKLENQNAFTLFFNNVEVEE